MTKRNLLSGALALLLVASASTAWSKATISIVNLDGANEGFNDPAPRAPVGGNSGTTLGQQRLIAFQFAASIWSCILDSDVNIQIGAQFNPLSCTATSGTLGSTGVVSFWRNFPNAPLIDTWYCDAEANALANADIGGAARDMTATFNSNLGTVGCLDNSPWYYGLDNNHTAAQIDLVTVLLHEFGHGLGFSSTVSRTSGAPLGGFLDQFSKYLHDNTTGLDWTAMTNAQRAASIINNQNLVWIGPSATAASSAYLFHDVQFTVTSPPIIAGNYVSVLAAFSAPEPNVTGPLELVVDAVAPTSDGCEALTNNFIGKIAVVDRGTCTFAAKILACQAVGAIGVIVCNNAAGSPIEMGGDGTGITIPAIMVSQADGNTIKAQLGGGVTATIGTSGTAIAGADPAGHVKMYAPNPSVSGSSTSHWDTSAKRNLLMEPAINTDLLHRVDLTFNAFTDMFWHFNSAPSAICQNITVGGDSTVICTANVTAAQVNSGSFDPQGDALTMSIVPSGPFTLGSNPVQFIVTDGCFADTCDAIITVDCPVAVRLASFSVARVGTGAELSWEVAEAHDHLGFRVFRHVAGEERSEISTSILSGKTLYSFIDPNPPIDGADYWLEEIGRSGSISWHGPAVLLPTSAPVPALVLARATPNPFSASTRISYALPVPGSASIMIHDAQGRIVRHFPDQTESAGWHAVTWDGNSDNGSPAPAGIYFVRLQAGNEIQHQKILLSR